MDENWVFLVEVDNDIEAEIICGFLQEKGIPARKADSSPYTGAMRVIGGLAVEIQILVPGPFLDRAKKLLDQFETNAE